MTVILGDVTARPALLKAREALPTLCPPRPPLRGPRASVLRRCSSCPLPRKEELGRWQIAVFCVNCVSSTFCLLQPQE